MRKTALFLALIGLIFTGLIFTSCDKNQVSGNVGLKFNTVTTPFPVLNAKVTSGTFQFTSGTIVLREINFEVKTDNDSVDVDFGLEQEIILDYATGQTTPDISYAQIPAGTYSKVEVEIELKDDGSIPSMLLNGIYINPNGDTIPIRLEYNSGESFEVEQEGTITIADNQTALAQITIDPSSWFVGVTDAMMANATTDAQGVIVISETQNTEIFDIVANNFDLAREMEISEDIGDDD